MRGIGGRGFGCGAGSFSGGFPGTPKYALRFFRPCRPCRSSHIRRLKPEANSRRPKRRRKRRASGLPALSCCLQRNLGEWTPAWAFLSCLSGTSFFGVFMFVCPLRGGERHRRRPNCLSGFSKEKMGKTQQKYCRQTSWRLWTSRALPR